MYLLEIRCLKYFSVVYQFPRFDKNHSKIMYRTIKYSNENTNLDVIMTAGFHVKINRESHKKDTKRYLITCSDFRLSFIHFNLKSILILMKFKKSVRGNKITLVSQWKNFLNLSMQMSETTKEWLVEIYTRKYDYNYR